MSRPIVPSRSYHRLQFGLAAVMAVGGQIYLLSARSRGLVTWEEFPAFALGFLGLAAVPTAIGCADLANWRRKRSALRAYEDQITWLVERANRPAAGQDPPADA